MRDAQALAAIQCDGDGMPKGSLLAGLPRSKVGWEVPALRSTPADQQQTIVLGDGDRSSGSGGPLRFPNCTGRPVFRAILPSSLSRFTITGSCGAAAKAADGVDHDNHTIHPGPRCQSDERTRRSLSTLTSSLASEPRSARTGPPPKIAVRAKRTGRSKSHPALCGAIRNFSPVARRL